MDKEKIIKGLHDIGGFIAGRVGFERAKNFLHTIDDAVAMLKEPKKTGHWIYKKYDDMFMCSCCEKYSIRNDYPYCHWCGAKMKGR